jgi:hypothetical protein
MMSETADQHYREITRRTPRPTTKQIHDFADWVSRDHSWYKHLPLESPGEAFFFYVNPHIMQAPRYDAEGRMTWKDVISFTNRPEDMDPNAPALLQYRRHFKIDGDADDQEIWEYAVRGLSADQQRKQFGHLDYWNHSYPGQPGDEAIAYAAGHCTVLDDDATDLLIPRSLLELGLVYLRGTVSPILGGHAEEEYADARRRLGLPGHRQDRARQLRQIRRALMAVVGWVYDN